MTGTCQEVDSFSAPLCFFATQSSLHSDGRSTNSTHSSLPVTDPKVGPFFTVAGGCSIRLPLPSSSSPLPLIA